MVNTIDMQFKDKVVVITGGVQGIGRCVADEFRKEGAQVYIIDKQPGDHFVGDVSSKDVLEFRCLFRFATCLS